MPSEPAPTTLFCLHFLGGSRRSWSALADRVGDAVEVLPIDLPGFGDNATHRGHAVAAMADHVAVAIANRRPNRYLLAGHSMGAKVAAAVARRAADGEAALGGLDGVVLLAGSPPGPEPIPDDRRAEMLGWFSADAARHRDEAEHYIRTNTGAPLPPSLHGLAVGDVLRAARGAWRAWLAEGSREDWSGFVGVLPVPALIVAGDADADLGPDAQRSLVVPHFPRHRFVVLGGAGHLLPLERPDVVARLIRESLDAPPAPAAAEPAVPEPFAALLGSERTARRTRAVLLERAAPPRTDRSVLPPSLRAVLATTLDALLPQPDGAAIDLAGRIDAGLADGETDGWRFDDLPDDATAMRLGLGALDRAARAEHRRPLAVLPRAQIAALLAEAVAGTLHAGAEDGFDAARLARWAGDLRAVAIRHWIAHPATLARIGYSGTFYAGDDDNAPAGFHAIGLGERDDWEPVAVGAVAGAR